MESKLRAYLDKLERMLSFVRRQEAEDTVFLFLGTDVTLANDRVSNEQRQGNLLPSAISASSIR